MTPGEVHMLEQNPWKSPFGRLIIGSAVVAGVVGFAIAAGGSGYLRSAAAAESTDSAANANFATDDENVSAHSDEEAGTHADAALNEADNAVEVATAGVEQASGYYQSSNAAAGSQDERTPEQATEDAGSGSDVADDSNGEGPSQ